MKQIWEDIWNDIREKTAGMSRKDAAVYILTYYWYHMLGAVSVTALILLFALHYAFGNKKPLFTCIIVNQEFQEERDLKLRDAFAEKAGVRPERIVIDSSYQFSYGQLNMEAVNESSYDKFFFQWGNHEIDAVIVSEDFYDYCREMGGDFYEIEEKKQDGMEWYQDEGQADAAVIGTDRFLKAAAGKEGGKLLLAFPANGEWTEMKDLFLEFMCEIQKEDGLF